MDSVEIKYNGITLFVEGWHEEKEGGFSSPPYPPSFTINKVFLQDGITEVPIELLDYQKLDDAIWTSKS